MKKIIAAALAFAPVVALAQNTVVPVAITDANTLSQTLINLGNMFTYLLVAVAVIFIIWNVVWYMVKGNDPEARGKAGQSIMWGIVGLFIILSIWGLVGILTGTFRTRTPSTAIPQIQQVINGNIPPLPGFQR